MQTLPASPHRIETGALKFGDDWPGVFIRGDEAIAFVQLIHHVSKSAESADLEGLRELERLLMSAWGPKDGS